MTAARQQHEKSCYPNLYWVQFMALESVVNYSILINLWMLLGLNEEQMRSLFAGFICMLIYGGAYTYGTLVPYFISYIYYHGDSSITSNRFAMLVPISTLVLNIGMPIQNIPQIRFSNKISTLISILGVSVSVFLVSLGTQFWHFLMLYGITFGLFIGYGYLAPIKNCYEHIPDRKGLCSGVCVLGYGIASLLYNFVLQKLINPDNQKLIYLEDGRTVFSLEVADNVPFALKIMSGAMLVLGLLGVFLIKPPQTVSSLIEVEEKEKQALNTNKDELSYQKDIGKLASYLIEKKIYLLVLTLTFSMPFGLFITYNYKEYGSIKIDDDSFLTTVGACGAACNGLGRLVFGMLFDRFSFKLLSSAVEIVFLMFSFTISFIVQNKYLYLVAVCLLYFVYGANFSLYPTQNVRIFGNELGTKVYFIVYTGFNFACLIQYFARDFIVSQDNKEDGFKTCFYIFGGCNVVSLLLTFFGSFNYEEDLAKVKNQEQ